MTSLSFLGKSLFAKQSSFSSSFHHLARRGFAAQVGDQLPSVELHLGFPPQKHNLADFAKDKDILLVGLPGAFTPTWYVVLVCTNKHSKVGIFFFQPRLSE